MAITSTVLLQLQAGANEILQKPENRDKNFGVFEKLWDNRQTLFPFLASPDGATAIDPEDGVKSAQVASFENKGDAVGTTRSSSHTGAALSTTTDTLTWATVSQPFGVSMKDATGNFFKEAAQMAQGMITARQLCLQKINTDALAFLDANKSGVSAVTSYPINNVTFDGTNDIHNVANGGKDLFFAIIQTIMEANNYGGFGIDFIHDYNLKQLALQFFNQGANNDVNKQYQIAQNFNYAAALISSASTAGLGYMFPTGSVGIITAIPKKNREGMAGDGQIWGSMVDPVYPGLVWALHAREVAQNGTKNQDLHKYFELSVDYSLKAAKLSTSDETVIQKVALLNA